MPGRELRNTFNYSQPVKGRVVQTRFGLRREPETKKPVKDASIFSYHQPGKGVNGESSN